MNLFEALRAVDPEVAAEATRRAMELETAGDSIDMHGRIDAFPALEAFLRVGVPRLVEIATNSGYSSDETDAMLHGYAFAVQVVAMCAGMDARGEHGPFPAQ